MAKVPQDLDAASNEALKELVQTLLQEVAELKRENAALREEIGRLKGKPPRPEVKASGLAEKAMGRGERAAKGAAGRKKRGRGSKRSRLEIDEDRVLKPANIPAGARFKGYADYVVQDLEVRARTIRYRRERWETPDGRTITADLPAATTGHYGAELQRLVLSLYHRGQMTIPRITRQLNDLGVDIEDRQVRRLLAERADVFLREAKDVLLAGVATAPWISVDDTGARHQARNGHCTQIGDDRFTAFATTSSKSRLDFLEILRAGHTDYVINVEALAYMSQRNLPKEVIERLAKGPTQFPDAAGWQAHLSALGLDELRVHPDPVRIATEGALWGAIKHHGLLADAVVLSDDAGQFRIGNHALCWVHAERLVNGLDTFNAAQRKAVDWVRQLIWWLYADLKAYAAAPTAQRKAQLKRRFERVFNRRTGFAPLDKRLRRLHARKAELLAVLDRPEVPLHTNGSENDIRSQVTRRKISGGTRSDRGRDCRDGFLALMKTCDKLGVSFWAYIGDRLGLSRDDPVAPLPDLVRARAPA
jgi:hypothetical protein